MDIIKQTIELRGQMRNEYLISVMPEINISDVGSKKLSPHVVLVYLPYKQTSKETYAYKFYGARIVDNSKKGE